MKKLRYFLEGISVRCAFYLLGLLPLSIASSLGGKIGRLIGPKLPRSNVARKNIHAAMPELDNEQIEKIIKDMCDNIGRTFCEFPNMGNFEKQVKHEVVSLEGIEHIDTVKKLNKGSIFVTGHLANWEMGPKAFSLHGFPLIGVYRKGNNPTLDSVIQNVRNHYQANAIPKGGEGPRQLLKSITGGEHIGVLIDQKMNDGMSIKFFGRDAMTGTVIAKLALKYNCPLIPTRIIRTEGIKHKVTIFPPIEINKTDNAEADVRKIMTEINAVLERWIRDNPAQWLWVHNRWPKESAQNSD